MIAENLRSDNVVNELYRRERTEQHETMQVGKERKMSDLTTSLSSVVKCSFEVVKNFPCLRTTEGSDKSVKM